MAEHASSGAPTPPVDMEYARHVLEAEARAVAGLVDRLGDPFADAARRIYACRGSVITSGIGKAGIIARKISATLASTGTPSHFLHAAEAVHGDLGSVGRDDLVLILSYGGETAEVTRLLGQLEKMGSEVVAMTGNRDSTLSRCADALLDLGEIDEACPMGLAPSASTTAMLALGDALALAVLKMRQSSQGFGEKDFALFHPGGSLGRKLLMVRTVMRTGDDLPVARDDVSVREALAGLCDMRRRSGAIVLVDDDGKLSGIFTDADLRRLIEGGESDAIESPVGEVMTRDPKCVHVDATADDAIVLFNRYFIEEIPVVDSDGRVVGLLDQQDLFAEGIGI